MIQNPDQGVLVLTAEAVFQFQIAATGGIEDDAVFTSFDAQITNMREHAMLGFLHVVQQATGGAYRQWCIITAKAFEIPGVELFAEQALGAVCFKAPGRLSF